MAFSDAEDVGEPLMYRRGDFNDSPPQARRGLDVVGGVLVVVAAVALLGCAAYASTSGAVDPASYGNGTLLPNPLAEFVSRGAKRGAPALSPFHQAWCEQRFLRGTWTRLLATSSESGSTSPRLGFQNCATGVRFRRIAVFAPTLVAAPSSGRLVWSMPL